MINQLIIKPGNATLHTFQVPGPDTQARFLELCKKLTGLE